MKPVVSFGTRCMLGTQASAQCPICSLGQDFQLSTDSVVLFWSQQRASGQYQASAEGSKRSTDMNMPSRQSSILGLLGFPDFVELEGQGRRQIKAGCKPKERHFAESSYLVLYPWPQPDL